jgi:hypothetical protein
MRSKSISIAILIVCAILFSSSMPLSYAVSNGSKTLVVPSQYPTIQSAINAAKPGDMIIVLSGTYDEQLFINKSVTLLGAGAVSTFIKEPTKLVTDSFGNFWGVHIAHGAKVTITGFTFSQPAGKPLTPCILNAQTNFEAQPCATIDVDGGASLSLSLSVVDYSFSTNALWLGGCGDPFLISCSANSGKAWVTSVDFEIAYTVTKNASFTGITVSTSSDLQLSYSKIVDVPTFGPSYGVFLTSGATASILHNTFIGAYPINSFPDIRADISYNKIMPTGLSIFGPHPVALTGGIGIGAGSNVKITYNTVVSGPNVYFGGILLTANDNASNPTAAYVAHNTISGFLCTDLTGRPAGYCGTNAFTQDANNGILVVPCALGGCAPGPYPQTTKNDISIIDNYVNNSDNGIALAGAQNCCVVSGNVIKNSADYAIFAADGSYTFSNTTIVGGPYAVTAVGDFGHVFGAGGANTVITMVHTTIQDISISPTLLQTMSPYTAKVIFKK